MSDLYWLTDEQMAKLSSFFPKSHGKPRVDDKRVLSGITFNKHITYGGVMRPLKTLYSRWKRWSEKGISVRMLFELADQSGGTDSLTIDATHLKTHRTA